jgi:hypothetical protein
LKTSALPSTQHGTWRADVGQTIGLRTVTARKPRPCLWCKDGIQPGEQYDKWMWKDGGDVDFLAMHHVCWEKMEEIRSHDPQWYGDEFPCDSNFHAKARGCYECDPDNERNLEGER